MKKELLKVKALLGSKLNALNEQKKSASLTDEQKTKIDTAVSEIQSALNDLDSAEMEATNEQLIAVFTKALEAISASSDMATASLQKEVEAKLAKIQSKLEKGMGGKQKVSASLSFKTLAAAKSGSDGFKPFTAGVDVTGWTPEAEIENVEVFHPLTGLALGFSISATTKTAIKIRKFEKGEGAAAVVINHNAKPAFSYVGEQSVVNVDTVAGVVEGIADEDLEDNAGLEAEIQQEALYELSRVENVLIKTLLDNAGQDYGNANFGTVAGADERTALAAIIDQVQQAIGTRTSGIAMALNSSQWAKLKDLRNANGTPIDIMSTIGNVRQIVDNTLANDEIFVWAEAFAKIRIYKPQQADWYKGVKVITTDGNITAVYSEWKTDESSLRARQREAIYITDDTTVVKGTISGVVAAITPSPVQP